MCGPTCIRTNLKPELVFARVCVVIRASRRLGGKESVCQCRRRRRHRFDPRVRKILWRRKWQPTPVFLPGKFHGQRSLEGCMQSVGCKESDTIEHASTHMHVLALTYHQRLFQREPSSFQLLNYTCLYLTPLCYAFAMCHNVVVIWKHSKPFPQNKRDLSTSDHFGSLTSPDRKKKNGMKLYVLVRQRGEGTRFCLVVGK